MKWLYLPVFFIVMLAGCNRFKQEVSTHDPSQDSIKAAPLILQDSITAGEIQTPGIIDSLFGQVNTGNITPDSIVNFAETLIGTPYLYASTDPEKGFDCSGFITYVFNHFKITVPRSSIDFTNVGKEVSLQDSKKGDLILFTGTDSTEKFVGHMGIIIANDNGDVQFIHSSSGRANGVVITPLNDYYKGRFVKVVRVFK